MQQILYIECQISFSQIAIITSLCEDGFRTEPISRFAQFYEGPRTWLWPSAAKPSGIRCATMCNIQKLYAPHSLNVIIVQYNLKPFLLNSCVSPAWQSGSASYRLLGCPVHWLPAAMQGTHVQGKRNQLSTPNANSEGNRIAE